MYFDISQSNVTVADNLKQGHLKYKAGTQDVKVCGTFIYIAIWNSAPLFE